MPFDGAFADRKCRCNFFDRKTIHIIQAANPACGNGQLHQVYVNVVGGELFKGIFLRYKPHFILDFHVVECLCFAVAEHGEGCIADSCVHPAEKFTLCRVVLIDIREHFQHAIVDRRHDVVLILEKVFTKREQDRVKLPVQFFLTLALPPPTTRQYFW